MKKYIVLLITGLLTFSWGCNDDKFLDKQPTDILLPEQVWRDKTLVLNVLADLYDRYPNYQHLQAQWEFGDLNEALISRNGANGRFQNSDLDYLYPLSTDPNVNTWSIQYAYIRDLNNFIKNIEEATPTVTLTEADKTGFLAEGRFLRAVAYFEMVKRLGGVPLILEPLEYDFSGDPTYLQYPRAKEHEVYDFVISELDAIKTVLPDDAAMKSRATKGAALALQSRAALYAGSIAKYGQTTPQVSLPGGEVGIPADMATAYYTKALAAAQEITGYSLYMEIPDNLSENFANLFLEKRNNPEVIFNEDFLLKHKFHNFTVESQPFSMTEESFGGSINPSLNIVAEFEKLDNTFAPLVTGTDVYYDEADDIFADRDARLGGTVITPGSRFKGRQIDIWGGYMLADKTIITSGDFVTLKTLPGKSAPERVVGLDGPIPGREYTAQTGFYIRKYLDPAGGAGSLGTQSDVAWIRFRYGEVLLNAAEAAFELGQMSVALEYINKVRARAGFTIPLTDLTFDRIVHERKVELAFEDHLLWDMKRWRLAHIVWNGNVMSESDLFSNLGEAEKPMTQVFGLIPYKVYTPENPATNGKWVFQVTKPSAVTNADRFRLGNYYSAIRNDVISNNPKLVRNPNQ